MLPYGRKTPLPFPISQRSHVGNLRQTLKGKGRFTRGWKPQVSTLLCPRRVGALPAEVQRKTSRPVRIPPIPLCRENEKGTAHAVPLPSVDMSAAQQQQLPQLPQPPQVLSPQVPQEPQPPLP